LIRGKTLKNKEMKYNSIKVYEAQIVEDEDYYVTLIHVCNQCRTTPEMIIKMVNEGILNPTGKGKEEWRFSISSIDTVLTVQRLQNDLNVNLAGAALAIQLLEKVKKLEILIEMK